VFASLAADAASLGAVLRRSSRVKVDCGAPVDLADGNEREILRAALRTGAAQHLRAGEDLLVLLERLNRMIEVSIGKRDPQRRTELGIQLLRAITICELMETESRERFPHHEPLARLSRETSRSLAQGCIRALGNDVAADLRRVFPRFSRVVRHVATGHDGQSPSLFRRWSLSHKHRTGEAQTAAAPEQLDAPTTT
jgi:hypothetical protein